LAPELLYSWLPGAGRVRALNRPQLGAYLLLKSEVLPLEYALSPAVNTSAFG
jgi:hypothetical protein